MAKFDRKKFREEQFKKSQQVEYNDPLENFQDSSQNIDLNFLLGLVYSLRLS